MSAWHFEPEEVKKEPAAKNSENSFYGLNIAPKILEILSGLKFTTPTPIQHKSIPVGIEGKDIIGIAQTGTGKTLSFAIPTIQRLSQSKGRALILVPTRELALQVNETFQKLVPAFGLKTAVLIGGASMGLQIQALRKHPRILIATPGRLIDHMEQRTIMLGDVNILILDEADRMLDMGFMPSIERILKVIPHNKQTMLFSATIPPEIMSIASRYMKLPITVEVAPSGTTAENITQELYVVKKDAKRVLLNKLLEQYHGSVLIFSRTKIGAKKITRSLREKHHKAAELHSDRTLGQRKEALEGFKNGRYRILVATDIAARGIDVSDIELVINYDLPEEVENYVHRIGRTARAGRAGRAISFATPEQESDVKSIEKLIKAPLPVSEHPDIPKEAFEKMAGRYSDKKPWQRNKNKPHYHDRKSRNEYRRTERPAQDRKFNRHKSANHHKKDPYFKDKNPDNATSYNNQSRNTQDHMNVPRQPNRPNENSRPSFFKKHFMKIRKGYDSMREGGSRREEK